MSLVLSRSLPAKLRLLFQDVRKQIDQALQKEGITLGGTSGDLPTSEWTQGFGFWTWRYCFEDGLKWWIGCGLYTPGGKFPADLGQLQIPGLLYAFINIATDSQSKRKTSPPVALEKAAKKFPKWKFLPDGDNPQCLRYLPAGEMAASPMGFDDAFRQWIGECLKEAVPMLVLAHQNV
jgi:hypothetical protein